MLSRVKYGLVVGVIGLVLNTCVSMPFGLCGPFVALLAGGAAGFLAVQQAKVLTKGDGARLGMLNGLIAGALLSIGQLLGGVGALIIAQRAGTRTLFGDVLPASGDAAQQIVYYLSGLGTAAAFGIVGLVLAILAGGAAGYLAAPVPVPPYQASGPQAGGQV